MLLVVGTSQSSDGLAQAPLARSLPGLIAFTDRDFGIMTVEPGNSGSQRVLVAGASYEVRHPAWSPDGRRLAYVQSTCAPTCQQFVVIADRDGRTLDKPLRTPSPAAAIYGLAWSPDGTRLAFACIPPSTATVVEICVLDIASRKHHVLTDPGDEWSIDGHSVARVSWAPDGKTIAYGATRPSDCPTIPGPDLDCLDSEIIGADVESGRSRRLTPAETGATYPDYSPDGMWLVYYQYGAAPHGIVVMPARGGKARLVVAEDHLGLPGHTAGFYSHPSWSPDGHSIVFGTPTDEANNDNTDLFIVSAAGGKIARTTDTALDDEEADWAPPIPACTIDGTPGKDVINGTPGADVICAKGGDDIVNGKGGDDTILGGAGNDKLYGGDGNDTIYGEAGNDLLEGGKNRDKLQGDDGDDTLKAKDGVPNEIVAGGRGRDACSADARDDLDGCP